MKDWTKRLVGWLSGTARADDESGRHDASERAAAHWNDWQQARDISSRRWHDWADHPLILRCIQRQLFGDPDHDVFRFLRQEYPGFADARALSLCCGDGRFEQLLVEQGVFGHVTGLDLAGTRIDAAQALAGQHPERLAFVTGDVNRGDFGEQLYDVVVAKAALHHVADLEALFAGIRRCLRPGGALVTIDYFGPTRFQWTERQLQEAQHLLLSLPEWARRRDDGSVSTRVERPTVEAMIALDPSEAVRSAELMDCLAATFGDRREFAIGGTLLHLVFTPDILHNLDPGNADHEALVARAFATERALIDAGELDCDFRFIVAR